MAGSRRKTPRKNGGSKSSGRKKQVAAGRGGSTWIWGGALVAMIGGILAYDNSAGMRRFADDLMGGKPQQVAARPVPQKVQPSKLQPPKAVQSERAAPVPVPRASVPAPAAETRQAPPSPARDDIRTAAITPPAPVGRSHMAERPSVTPAALRPQMPSVPGEGYRAKFYLCGTAKQDDCVVAADTFMLKGQKIRIAGIEVPDIRKPRCEAERIKASDAKLRVRAFLDSGPFDVIAANAGDEDSSGQKIRAVTRDGVSLADILVREGLAKRPGAAGGWC